MASGSVNKVILIGNLGADPEVRSTKDGRPVVTLSIATGESWKDRNTGERQERTEWHRVVIFSEGLCRIAEQYLRKGSKVYLEGRLQTRKWQDQDGKDRYTTEVVMQGFNATLTMLDSRRDSAGGDAIAGTGGAPYPDTAMSGTATSGATTSGAETPEMAGVEDDEIPF